MKTARVVLMGLVFLGVWGKSQACWARLIGDWPLAKLQEMADLVVIAVSGDTSVGTQVPPANTPWNPVVTTFTLRAVLKADPQGTGAARYGLNPTGGRTRWHTVGAIESLIKVNHLQGAEHWSNGPQHVYFDGKPRTYLLFLRRGEGENYEFITSPWDPYISAKVVSNYEGRASRPDTAPATAPPDWAKFNTVQYNVPESELAAAIVQLPADKKEEALKQLHQALKSPEHMIRRRAVVTLRDLGDDRGVPVLIADLAKLRPHEQMVPLQLLCSFGDRRAIPALREALRNKRTLDRNALLAALGELKATEAFDEIVRELRDQETSSYEDKELPDYHPLSPADHACYALGMLGDMRAVPILIEHLKKAKRPGPARHALETLKKQHEGQQRQKLANDPEKWAAWWKKQAD